MQEGVLTRGWVLGRSVVKSLAGRCLYRWLPAGSATGLRQAPCRLWPHPAPGNGWLLAPWHVSACLLPGGGQQVSIWCWCLQALVPQFPLAGFQPMEAVRMGMGAVYRATSPPEARRDMPLPAAAGRFREWCGATTARQPA